MPLTSGSGGEREGERRRGEEEKGERGEKGGGEGEGQREGSVTHIKNAVNTKCCDSKLTQTNDVRIDFLNQLNFIIKVMKV